MAVHVPLTLDHSALQSVLSKVGIGLAGDQGTAIGSAVAVSAKRLKDLDAPERLIVLLTDGRNNSGRVSPMQAAQAAAALDMKVYTIGVGRQRRAMLGAFDGGIDERMLTEIAEGSADPVIRGVGNPGYLPACRFGPRSVQGTEGYRCAANR